MSCFHCESPSKTCSMHSQEPVCVCVCVLTVGSCLPESKLSVGEKTSLCGKRGTTLCGMKAKRRKGKY